MIPESHYVQPYYRVLVCGSRDFPNKDIVYRVLDGLYHACMEANGPFTLIHGACNTPLDTRENKTLWVGADAYAYLWAMETLESDEDSPDFHIPCPAEWERYGKRAGFMRNSEMLSRHKPDAVFGFMNETSKGTSMMLDIAKHAHIPAFRIGEW